MENEHFSPMQQVKRRLYAMRNGIVADALRKGGCPRRLIFGVNLPQLNEIAAITGKSKEMALALWADKDLRESQLLAPMIFPVEELNEDIARQAIANLMWPEEADMLVFKLMRHAPFALELAREYSKVENPVARYFGLRMWLALVNSHPNEAREAANYELKQPAPLHIAHNILEHLETNE